METIKLRGHDFEILKEYDSAISLNSTTGMVISIDEMVEINFGQKVYDVKLLKNGSLIFKISENDEQYVIHKIPQFFGFPSGSELSEIINYKKRILKLHSKINKIVERIKINP